jgi:hypothetical protein
MFLTSSGSDSGDSAVFVIDIESVVSRAVRSSWRKPSVKMTASISGSP